MQRVAQSYLGSLWIVLDQRQGEPGKALLLRRVQLPADTPREARQHVAEAGRAAIGLRHPNLLPPLEVIEEGEELSVLHDQTEAEPLRSLQSWANLRGLTFPPGVSLKILSDLLQGLSALHAAARPGGISPFGGLSPDSVLVTRAGDACLCDPLVASCAALLEGVGFNTAKLGYAAPEQVHAVAPLTPASDVFACGAMLWELLAARKLLSGSRATIERKLLEHNLPSLSSSLRSDQKVSSGLIELVERCLSADAAKRPNTPAALLEELKRCGQQIATQEQVAQFVSKLSGQRLDRRSAAVRSKSLPELEIPQETVASGQSSRRAAAAPSSPGSDTQTEHGSEPAASSKLSSAHVATAAPKQPSAFSMPRPQERAAAAGLSRTMLGTGGASAPSLQAGASAPRSEKKPAPPAPVAAKESAPAAAKESAPAAPQQPKQAQAQATKNETRQAAENRAATPPTSARKPTPSYIEPPPIPESAHIEEDEENDATIREQPPEDWMPAAPAAARQASAAPSAAPAVPIVPQVAGRRTVAGVGVPPHPALSATLPFTNITPGPFAAAQSAAPQPGLLQSGMPQSSTQPTVTATAQSGMLDPGLPQPSTLPSLAASSTGAPPVPVAPSGPTPAAPVSQTYVSPPPSSARPSTRASGESTAPGSRSLPAGIPSLRGYEPTFAMAPEELVPRVSPSARVVRPRSGWESTLGRRGSRLSRTVFAGAAACVALASAIVIVLFLRRPAPSATLEDNAAAVQREPAPEAAQAEPLGHDAPAPTPAPAPAPAAADDDGEDAKDSPGETAEAAENVAAPGAAASPQLDDRQLVQLFALEHYEPWPSCPERPPVSKAKAKAKKNAAKDAKEAVRLLKAARSELIKGNNEKAQSLLCRATTHDPSNSQAQQALAELALRFGNSTQAQASIQRALARKPEDATLLGIQGDALVLAGDLPGSRRVWLRANPSPGTDEERMRSLAGTYRKLGDRLLGGSSYAAACALFRRSLVLNSCGSSPQPECKGSYAPGIGLAESLRRLHQPRAALAWAERTANAFPKDARVQLLLGDILFDNGQKQEAKNAWAAARKAQPSNVLAAQRLAKGKP